MGHGQLVAFAPAVWSWRTRVGRVRYDSIEPRAEHGVSAKCVDVAATRPVPVLRQNLGRRQVVDLSALIRTQSQLDDPSPAPPASIPSLPVRRPPPARPREPGLAPPARRLQANGDPAATAQN